MFESRTLTLSDAENFSKKWTMPIRDWTAALNRHFLTELLVTPIAFTILQPMPAINKGLSKGLPHAPGTKTPVWRIGHSLQSRSQERDERAGNSRRNLQILSVVINNLAKILKSTDAESPA